MFRVYVNLLDLKGNCDKCRLFWLPGLFQKRLPDLPRGDERPRAPQKPGIAPPRDPQIDIGIYIYITDCMGIERTYSVGILWKYIYTISIKQQFPGLWVYHQHSPTI